MMMRTLNYQNISWIVSKNSKGAIEEEKWGIAKPQEPFGCGGTWYGDFKKAFPEVLVK